MVNEENFEKPKIEDKTESLKRSFKILKIVTVGSVAVMILLIFFVFFQSGGITGSSIQSFLTPEEAADKAIVWIESFFEAQGASVELTLIDVIEENGVYRFTATMSSDQGEDEVTYYVSKDGSLFFPQAIETEEIIEASEEPEQPQQETEGVPKSDKPVANAFVMSYCPYGLQFLKAYVPVLELLDGKADLSVNFVHYIMHGKSEIDENTRMYCIQKEQEGKFAAYLRCFVQSDDWEGCVDDVGVDKSKLENCITLTDAQFNITGLYEDQSTWSNGRYPQYPVDAALAQLYGVAGSPTFVVNGKTLSVNRSPEAIKQAICSAFNSPPAECDQTLSTTAEAPGIGALESGSGSGSSGVC